VESNVDNTFNIELFKKTISRKVKLVSMVHTSNFDGYTIPAREIIEIAHDYGALVLLDAAQSVPHMNVDVQKMDVDFLTFSVHKLCGPTGIGVFYGKQELLEKLRPFVIGGGTVMNTTYSSSTLLPPPQKFEGGLQNFAGIIGGGVAINYITNIGLENIKNYVYKLNKMLTGLLKDLTGISIIGPLEPALRGGIFSFNLEGFESHELALILDDSNIFIRSGMHCAHSWFNARKINGCARVSLYFYNTTDEIRIFAEKIKQIARSKS
jgi:cysteine desulfurase/selenocysteine lyase